MYCDVINCVGSLYDVSEQSVDGKKKSFKVIFEKDESIVGCSCLKFESAGLLCRHAISVFFRNSITLLLQKYILRR